MLDENALKVIEEILARGNCAEVRMRKNEIVIIEINGKLKYRVAIGG